MGNVIELLIPALQQGGTFPSLHIATLKKGRALVQTTSFREMAEMIRSAQRLLKEAGAEPGDRLLVLADVSAECYAAIVASVALGCAAVFAPSFASLVQTLSFLRKQRGAYAVVRASNLSLRILLRVLGIKAIISDEIESVASDRNSNIEIINSAQDRPALISYSSGTTGAPKPIFRSHGTLKRQFELIDKYMGVNHAQIDFTYLGVMALFNMAKGWASLIPAGMDYTEPAVSHELGRLVDRYRPTRFTGSATFINSALQNASRSARAAVEYLVLGGAPTEAKVLRVLMKNLSNTQIMIFYGSTEAEPISILRVNPDISRQYAGEGYPVGKPIAEIELKIDTDGFHATKISEKFSIGEIFVKGAHVIGDKDSGWLKTGDTGYLDEDGQLWLTGRAKEAIAHDGIAIPTYLIEKSINDLADVERSAVVRHVTGTRLYVEIAEGAQLDSHLKDALIKKTNKWLSLNTDVRCVSQMPLDKRHRCKINRRLLEEIE